MISSWIAGLMRTETGALGFIPEPTIEYQYVRNNRYIIIHDDKGKRVGYLLHGAIRQGQNPYTSRKPLLITILDEGCGEFAG